MKPSATAETPLDLNDILVSTEGQFTATVTIENGQNLSAGAVLGEITGSDWTLSATGAGDGSEVASAVLAEDCDASGGAKSAIVYFAGRFNANRLTFGTGHTADSLRQDFAQRGLFLYDAVPA
ncbi:head decoration protein [Maricaulis maris]|uniref:head decoration protein n=1 Tax=Maricaulis maris TaxID=74318 RepID=UPI003B8BCD69